MNLDTNSREILKSELFWEGRVGGRVEHKNGLGVACYVVTVVDYVEPRAKMVGFDVLLSKFATSW